MLYLKKGCHFNHFLKKFEFHQGYNQFNTNDARYGVYENDTIVVDPKTKRIWTADRPWISWDYWYTYGGDEKFFNIVKSGIVVNINNLKEKE